jgi:hypothetical protein
MEACVIFDGSSAKLSTPPKLSASVNTSSALKNLAAASSSSGLAVAIRNEIIPP